jgi:hypothetical protein
LDAKTYHLAMTASPLRVRRATIDDLALLRPLWESMHLPVSELEPRLTEFQIAEDAEGKIIGEIAFLVGGDQGCLHSEGFTDFGQADSARELLWQRIQTLATNHGVLRLWMQDEAPFWIQLGFKPPGPEELKKLPGHWISENPSWLTLQLKNEAAIYAVTKELAVFMNTQKRQSERTLEHMRTVKMLATILAFIFAICAFGAAIFLMLKRAEYLHPGR